MKEDIKTNVLEERDLQAAVKSLNSTAFKRRFIRTDLNIPDPIWKTPNGQSIKEKVHKQMDSFKKEVANMTLHSYHSSTFQKYDAKTILTIADHQPYLSSLPKARDLLHVYGPDRNNVKDREKYYCYAWNEKGPNAIIYSNNAQAIQEGHLACNTYAYSGQNSFALVGTGLFFRPLYGDSKISIRPYVQWLTSASFTGTESAPASAVASLGIYIESFPINGGEGYLERDLWIPVWSQNTQGYQTKVTAGGSATGVDGLSAEILTVTQRKYYIYVYAFLETSAGPQMQKNEIRFVTLDIDASVPYVVVEEKLVSK